jgi:GntR family transcriptional repressor for pyruvate dehydrogenase complex
MPDGARFLGADPDPSPAPSAVDACADALRNAILSGELPAGVRLPAERALAQRFGVNRVTVRGALSRLEAEHLVSVRQGSGYTVRDYLRAGGPDLIATLATLARSPAVRESIFADLLRVRRSLARSMLELLGNGAPAQALEAAERAIDALEAAAVAGASPAELAARDLDVAAAFVRATGSSVLALCMNPVASLLAQLPELQQAMFRDPLSNVAGWRGALAWARVGRGQGIELMLDTLAARDDATVRVMFPPAPRKKPR